MGIAALGFRAHSGWAVVVAVGGAVAAPEVIRRERIELADRGITGSVQPYHAAKQMEIHKAEAFLDRCTETSRAIARNAVQAMVCGLAEEGYKLSSACILLGSGRLTKGLAAILAAHAAIHTAEGEFFREALRLAVESCGLSVSGIKEREVTSQCGPALRLRPDEIERRISAMGKAVGPPWRQDEKLCALAGWLMLGRDPTNILTPVHLA
ncbi:MAG TPA: hypothetical protein VH325_17780 [Bryobacteraceae bacterium]|jgi:hypothetical protein|nr:hypothetical protein [Bryobacteraceae bacterium]